MSPPKLPTNAPVLNVVHPIVVGFRPVFGDELDAAGFDGFYCRFGQRLDFYIPLIRQVRLDNGLTAVAPRDLHYIVFNLFQQPEFFEFGDNGFARIKAVHTAVGFRHLVIQGGIVVQDVVNRQVVSLTDVIVIEIMCRRYFYAAGTEFRIDVVVGDDGNPSTDYRQLDFLTNEMLITLVIWMHSDCAITQHRFRASRRNNEMAVTRCQRVAEIP